MAEVKKRTLRTKLETNLALPSTVTLETWRANATDIQVAIYDADGVAAITDIQSVNCKVQPSQLDDTTLMDSTVASASMDADLTDAEWLAGTDQHATFSFTNSETNLTLTLPSLNCWIVFTATLTGGEEVTLAAGTLTIHEDNNAAGDPPATNPGTAITIEEADARYLQSMDWEIKTDDFTAVNGGRYVLNNAAKAFMITLPDDVPAHTFEIVVAQWSSGSLIGGTTSGTLTSSTSNVITYNAAGAWVIRSVHIPDVYSRSNHTGAQSLSTISDAGTAAAADVEDLPVSTAQKAAIAFDLQQTNQRMVDLSTGSWTGTTRNTLTLMGIGDSLGNRIIEQLDPMTAAKFGNVGYGLQELTWVVTSGTVTIPATNAQRRSDLWASGYVAQIATGGVMTIGREVPGSNESLYASDVSLYFARESGAGTVKVETSDDEGATWDVLDASVDTNNATTDALIKTYTGLSTTTKRVIRLTGLTGNVEFIGALMYDTAKRGAIIVRSNTGGQTLTNAVTANATIQDAVMADIAPELIIHHYYEETAAMTASFSSYVDLWITSSPSSDHVWIAEHEQDGTGDKETNNNPIARAKAATTPRLQVLEFGYYTKSFANLTAMGWNANDAVHLEAADGSFPAWRAAASEVFSKMNTEADKSSISENKFAQTASSGSYEKDYPDTSVLTYKRIGAIYNYKERNSWVDSTTDAENYYETYRVKSSDATLPLGLTFARQIGTNYRYVWQMDTNGRFHLGSESSLIVPDGRLVVKEFSNTVPAIKAINSATSGNRYMQTWEDNTGEIAYMRQGGDFSVDGTAKAGTNTFANIPSSGLLEGDTFNVTDSNTAVWGATVAGGGSNHVAVRYNGTNWTVTGI